MTSIICPHCGKAYVPSHPTLTKPQLAVLKAIVAHVATAGVVPTYVELAAACGFRSGASAHAHVAALLRKGYLARDGGRRRRGAARGLYVLVDPDHVTVAEENGGARPGSGAKLGSQPNGRRR